MSEEQVSLVLILLLCSPILHGAQRACAGDSEYDRDFAERVFKVRPQSNLLLTSLPTSKSEYEFIRACTRNQVLSTYQYYLLPRLQGVRLRRTFCHATARGEGASE